MREGISNRNLRVIFKVEGKLEIEFWRLKSVVRCRKWVIVLEVNDRLREMTISKFRRLLRRLNLAVCLG